MNRSLIILFVSLLLLSMAVAQASIRSDSLLIPSLEVAAGDIRNDSVSISNADLSECLSGWIINPVFPPLDADHMTDLVFVDESGQDIDIFDHYPEVFRIYRDEGVEFEDWVETSHIQGRIVRIYWDHDMVDDDDRRLKKATLRVEVEGYEPVRIRVKRPRHKEVRKIKLRVSSSLDGDDSR